MKLPIVHHPDYDARLPPTHRFPMAKYRLLMDALAARGLVGGRNLVQPAPAAAKQLQLAHETRYVDQVLGCAVPAAVEKEIGFPVNEAVSRRAQLATGGTILAARIALDSGLACNTAGGSHHARRVQGAGFCTFNDVAVAGLVLAAEGAIRRALVVDLDVHQGDGTADICAAEPKIFTFSMHARSNYPVRKIDSDLDLALDDGMGDEAYLGRLREILPVLEAYARPDLLFYNAGVDPHRDDRLGRLALSDEGLRLRDRMVLEFWRARSIPVCAVIGGGYSTDVRSVAERHAILFEEAAKLA